MIMCTSWAVPCLPTWQLLLLWQLMLQQRVYQQPRATAAAWSWGSPAWAVRGLPTKQQQQLPLGGGFAHVRQVPCASTAGPGGGGSATACVWTAWAGATAVGVKPGRSGTEEGAIWTGGVEGGGWQGWGVAGGGGGRGGGVNALL